jgi:hypothetical protein
VPSDASYLKNVWGESWKSGIDFDLVVNGFEDKKVEIGAQVRG